MKNPMLVPVVAIALLMAACGNSDNAADNSTEQAADLENSTVVAQLDCPAADDAGVIQIADGLTATILKKGYGRAALNDDYADTNVWLWHYDAGAEDKRGQFVWESGDEVFQFQIGRGQVIKGWDLGVPCMLEGETRELIVAPDLAYGANGRGAAIPPNTTLIFTIELIALKSPG